MEAGVLFALTLPGVVLLLLVVAVLEHTASRLGRRSAITRTHRRGLSAAGLDAFAQAVSPAQAVAVEQAQVEESRRDEEGDAAPPR